MRWGVVYARGFIGTLARSFDVNLSNMHKTLPEIRKF